MATVGTCGRVVPDIHHSEIMRSVLERMISTGDVLGRDRHGRTVLVVAVEDWLFDELAASAPTS